MDDDALLCESAPWDDEVCDLCGEGVSLAKDVGDSRCITLLGVSVEHYIEINRCWRCRHRTTIIGDIGDA